jgi:hypothetical protein
VIAVLLAVTLILLAAAFLLPPRPSALGPLGPVSGVLGLTRD